MRVAGDAHEGLKRAIQEVFPGAAWQRCIVHLMRNAAGNTPTRQKRGAVLGIPKAVFAERDPELVREPYQLATEQIEGFCPKAAEAFEEAEADAPACLDFPCEHHVRLRTNDVQERADRELKRRSRAVQVFPGRKSPIRMMDAVFAEMGEEWAGRRRFNGDSFGRAVEGAAAEHAARIVELVVADSEKPVEPHGHEVAAAVRAYVCGFLAVGANEKMQYTAISLPFRYMSCRRYPTDAGTALDTLD